MRSLILAAPNAAGAASGSASRPRSRLASIPGASSRNRPTSARAAADTSLFLNFR